MTVPVTRQQAAYLANLIQQAQQAQRAVNEAVALLALGRVPPSATLSDVNVETGVLTFTGVNLVEADDVELVGVV